MDSWLCVRHEKCQEAAAHRNCPLKCYVYMEPVSQRNWKYWNPFLRSLGEFYTGGNTIVNLRPLTPQCSSKLGPLPVLLFVMTQGPLHEGRIRRLSAWEVWVDASIGVWEYGVGEFEEQLLTPPAREHDEEWADDNAEEAAKHPFTTLAPFPFSRWTWVTPLQISPLLLLLLLLALLAVVVVAETMRPDLNKSPWWWWPQSLVEVEVEAVLVATTVEEIPPPYKVDSMTIKEELSDRWWWGEERSRSVWQWESSIRLSPITFGLNPFGEPLPFEVHPPISPSFPSYMKNLNNTFLLSALQPV